MSTKEIKKCTHVVDLRGGHGIEGVRLDDGRERRQAGGPGADDADVMSAAFLIAIVAKHDLCIIGCGLRNEWRSLVLAVGDLGVPTGRWRDGRGCREFAKCRKRGGTRRKRTRVVAIDDGRGGSRLGLGKTTKSKWLNYKPDYQNNLYLFQSRRYLYVRCVIISHTLSHRPLIFKTMGIY